VTLWQAQEPILSEGSRFGQTEVGRQKWETEVGLMGISIFQFAFYRSIIIDN